MSSQIVDLPAIQHELLDLGERWQRDWVVVTEVVEARSAAIVVSSRSGGRLDLNVQGGGAGSSLAELASRVQVASESGIAARVVSPEKLTPLFRVCQLRGGRVRKMSLVYRGGEDSNISSHEAVFDAKTESDALGGHRDSR
ncbi:hypothetical protein ACFWC5_35535 [Streptomyces sp. NPDC060085]|uniref:hypothetical protein n=1 Tax=Streptomyces sp. NPDC060085 TaxID=3347054 RepID=UPI0036557888